MIYYFGSFAAQDKKWSKLHMHQFAQSQGGEVEGTKKGLTEVKTLSNRIHRI